MVVFLCFDFWFCTYLIFIFQLENVVKFGNVEEKLVDMDEGLTERRIVLEIQDYEGTGANRDHDPKSPGRV
ncbi:hypothetical protein TanjilG_03821 [Lupinus angustifolius]|uniref:Uncharacterized protein n=1 Tax=Lupinus angustifolius TaxID=3871 RepID=A0A394DEK7_LUPAN|nr:hypothetical protein TanjilG_03821 [Lupinus angustifolius]